VAVGVSMLYLRPIRQPPRKPPKKLTMPNKRLGRELSLALVSLPLLVLIAAQEFGHCSLFNVPCRRRNVPSDRVTLL
jgi:hypothetical protein